MSLRSQGEEEDENIQDNRRNSRNVSAPFPSPSSLQWVSVGKGGRVSSAITVRSHVSKEYHQKRRDVKKAIDQRLSLQKHAQLRAGWVSPDDIRGSPESGSGNVAGAVTGNAVVKLLSRSFHSPRTSIDYQANMIPYAWFEKDGPVLYVNRSRWPFPAPLDVTSSDRKYDIGKSLTPRQSAWMPYTRRADYVPVKGAVLDSKVLLWIGQSPECFQFRVNTIKWIQDQLNDPARATTNNTIGSIMTFAMWTAGYGNPEEMSSHMDAIERIVKLRGGLRRFQDDGPMIEKLKLFDSMIAVQTGKPTRFPPIYYLVSRPVMTGIYTSMVSYESPLFGSGNFDNVIVYHKTRDAIISLMNTMWALTWKYQTTNSEQESHDTVPFIPDQPYYAKIPLLTLPLISRCTDPSHNHILETLLSAGAIYSRSLSNPTIDFPLSINDQAFQDLCKAFGKCSNDDFWVAYPGVLLWVLLVGTAVARGKKEAAFWMFYLSRTGSFPDAENWLAGNSAITKFLKIQMWMRQAAAT